MRNEYLALSAHCLEGGESASMDFIINRHVRRDEEERETSVFLFVFKRIIFRSTNPMIVAWSENYLRTSLASAFNTIRTTPPNISSYLVEPPPPAPAAAPQPAPVVRPVENVTTTTTTTMNMPEVFLSFCSS